MKTTLLAIGKTDNDFIETGIRKYTDRLAHYTQFELKIVPDIRNTKNLSEEQQKQQEGEALLAQIAAGDVVCLLDEKGTEMTSREFASYIERIGLTGSKRLVFVIGGPYGFAQSVYDRTNFKISLSRMTFSHQMVRMIFAEQLYRAHTILKGEPYHHD